MKRHVIPPFYFPRPGASLGDDPATELCLFVIQFNPAVLRILGLANVLFISGNGTHRTFSSILPLLAHALTTMK